MTPPPPPATTHPLALPPSFSPDAIDALTELSLILSELKPVASSTQPGASQSQPQNPSQSQNLSQSQTVVASSSGQQTQPGPNTDRQSSHPPGQTQSQSQDQPPPPADPLLPAAPQQQSQHPFLPPTIHNIGDLPLRDIAAAADEIKHKLQRARTQMRGLPDMGRKISEQEEEMRYLEERMREQRKVLEMLRGVRGVPGVIGGGDEAGGGGNGNEDVKMEGT
ncbi:Microtubule-associated protein [Zalerion maritima]|uniref:Mediator of RNA polymerase II transcription subunit 9 n=1 Tax=Zalerion maritima TaxID=339359 RepID=A0AAD5WSE4_9PEZI|nr:Microtubule-associated protein [Zalerion maritima]